MAILTGNRDPIQYLTERVAPEDFECAMSAETFGLDGVHAKYGVVGANFFDANMVESRLFGEEIRYDLRPGDRRNPVNNQPDNERLYLLAPRMDQIAKRFSKAVEETVRLCGDQEIAKALITRHWGEPVIHDRQWNVSGSLFQNEVTNRLRSFRGRAGEMGSERAACNEYRVNSQLPFKAEVIPIAVLGRLARVIREADETIPNVVALKEIAERRFATERVESDFEPGVLEDRFGAHAVPPLQIGAQRRIDGERSGEADPNLVSIIYKAVTFPFLWLYYFFCTFSFDQATIEANRAY